MYLLLHHCLLLIKHPYLTLLKEQKMLVLEHQGITTAARSTMQVLNNTEKIAKTKKSELK